MKTEKSAAGIDYTLIRNRGQRNLRVHLDPYGKPIVSAPYGISQSEIDDFVTKSAPWIEKHRSKVSDHDYSTGDFVPFLGKKMTLMVIEGKKARYDVIDDKIIITTRKNEVGEIKKTIKNLYIDTIKSKMDVLVPHWCNELGLKVPEYGVNRAKGKWGVCYPVEGRLYLSYMCATLSEDLIDMTVLHEVCHLVYSGHGKRFWCLMKTHMLDLEQRKAELAKVAKSGWSMNIV